MVYTTMLSLVFISGGEGAAGTEALRDALTFHVSFDGGFQADFALGDPGIYTAPTEARKESRPGVVNRPDVVIEKEKGRYGDAMRMGVKTPIVVFYKAEKNLAYRAHDWNGTVSFWLRLDPDRDLTPGFFADPIQITEKQWDNASLFVDFTRDEKPRQFRYAVFSDYDVWNPKKIPWDLLPVAERPMAVVERPPFGSDRWTHVVMTFAHLNTDRADASAVLYLNGKKAGELKGPWKLTWDPAKASIMLGLHYIGLFDDLSAFHRSLTSAEVEQLYRLPNGVKSLGKPAK